MSRSNVTAASPVTTTVFPRAPEVCVPASRTANWLKRQCWPCPEVPGEVPWNRPSFSVQNVIIPYCQIIRPLKSEEQTILASTTPTQIQWPGTVGTGTLGWSISLPVRICTARVDSRIVCFYRLIGRTIVEDYSQMITPCKLDNFDLAFKYEYVGPIWTKLVLQDSL
jgi:hypothetical protein